MAESKKLRFYEYFNRNKNRLLNMMKKHGQFLKFSTIHGYVYSLEVGEVAGKTVSLQVGLKAGEVTIIDVLAA